MEKQEKGGENKGKWRKNRKDRKKEKGEGIEREMKIRG